MSILSGYVTINNITMSSMESSIFILLVMELHILTHYIEHAYDHIIYNIAFMGSYLLLVPTQGVIHIIILPLKLQLVAIVVR